jgi:peptidoglycan/LPS O-acetylase OafA/YrhL
MGRLVVAQLAIPGLDIARFSAACMVMVYHLGAISWAVPETVAGRIFQGAAKYPEIFPVSWFGFVGVEIFFVISGFVITLSAENATPRSFLRSRIARLYPAVWLCAPLSALVLVVTGVQARGAILKEYFRSITLYPLPEWIDSVYWTLGIEMVFYSAVLCLLAFDAFVRVRTFAYAMGAVSAAYWLLGSMLWPEFIRTHLWDRALELSLVPYGIYFSLGILGYSVFRQGYSALSVSFCLLLICAASIEIDFKAQHNNLTFQSDEPRWIPSAIFAAVLIYMVATARWKSSERFARIFRLIGLSTYPLYLLHDQFGTLTLKSLILFGAPRYAALFVSMAVCIAVSALIAIKLEPPIQRIIKWAFDGVF